MEKKWRYRCIVCGKEWGDKNGKLLQTFCTKCQKKIRNSNVLKDYMNVIIEDEGGNYEA